MKKDQGENWFLRFFYHTILGRMLLKLLVNPCVSKIAGWFMDSRVSSVMIPFFRRKHGISMRDVIVPEGGFPSFNAFFCRKKKAITWQELREEHALLTSPCDAFLTCITIQKDQIFDVKHTRFSLTDLLRDKTLAHEFEGGTALIFRLTPSHYHRYAYAADGEIKSWRRLSGVLHSVRPICTREVPVYCQNAREYQVVDTERFGRIVQMEVGALLIGRITNERPKERRSVRGLEKGRFEFGGSTIILLLQKDQVRLREEILNAGRDGGEVSVQYGEILNQA